MIGHDYLLVLIPILTLPQVSQLPYFFFVLSLILFVPLSSPFSLIPSTPPSSPSITSYPSYSHSYIVPFGLSFPIKNPSPLACLSLQLFHRFVFVFHSSTASKKDLLVLFPLLLSPPFLTLTISSHLFNCTLHCKGTFPHPISLA